MARIAASSERDVIEAVRAARETKRTIEIVGAGTKQAYGRLVECDDVLELSALRGIVKYEPDELVMTALAGTPVTDIEAALAEKNQRLGFQPADWGPLFGAPANSATVGGVLAADASGSAAVRFGRARDHLLGFRAVNGFGEAYKAGGRVVKNVTGFDLPKLMCGAMGTLGPMTEVTLRLFPKPTFSIGLVVRDLPPADGLTLLRRIWGTPLEATGLAYLSNQAAMSLPLESPACALIRLEGEKTSLNEKRAAVRALVPQYNFEEIGDSDWVLHMLSAGAFFNSSANVRRLHVAPAEAADLIEAIRPQIWWADWAGAVLWIGTEDGTDIRKIVRKFGGRGVVMRAPAETKKQIPVFEEQDAVRTNLTRSVKAAFDPLRLFNPGRMWEGV